MKLPLFFAKKEVFKWLVQNKKTIDIRKGNPKPGEIAVFQSGPHILRLKILKKEYGMLTEILRLDNFKAVIPSAMTLGSRDTFGFRESPSATGMISSKWPRQ